MATIVANQLLEKLIQKQNDLRLNDAQFARKLGIVSRQLWQFTKTGKREVGFTLLRAVLRTYPDLTSDVIEYLRDGGKG